MDKGTDVHPQDGNFKNAALTFFHANENSSDLKTKIQNANKEFRRGNNGWISVQIDSDDDIKALEDAIKYWFDFRKSEFNRRQEPERVCETGQCND